MIRLILGHENTIEWNVENSVDIEGFTATLLVGGIAKEIVAFATAKKGKLTYSSEEVQTMGIGRHLGLLKVFNAQGETHLKMLPEFEVVPEDSRLSVIDYQYLPIVIVAILRTDVDSGGGSEEIIQHIDDLSTQIEQIKGDTDELKQSVNGVREDVSGLYGILEGVESSLHEIDTGETEQSTSEE